MADDKMIGSTSVVQQAWGRNMLAAVLSPTWPDVATWPFPTQLGSLDEHLLNLEIPSGPGIVPTQHSIACSASSPRNSVTPEITNEPCATGNPPWKISPCGWPVSPRHRLLINQQRRRG